MLRPVRERVWTSGIANDFEYRNNVVDRCNYFWTAQGGSPGRPARRR
jgi:hypothetical protein